MLRASPVAHINQSLLEIPKVKKKEKVKKLSKEKTWIQFRLEDFSKETGLKLTEEYFKEKFKND